MPVSVVVPSRAPSHSVAAKSRNEEQLEVRKEVYERYEERVSCLPKMSDGWYGSDLYEYHGFWFSTKSIMGVEGVMAVQDTFKAESTDILLPTSPKCGTTWLKALAFAIMNRKHYSSSTSDSSNHPLLTANPHECVPFLEKHVFQSKNDPFAQMASPRLLATHIPYALLPESVLTSGCRLVYLCRNPKDVLVSFWCFGNKLKDIGVQPMTLEEVFEQFCKGVTLFGPYWDHVLGYYKASLEHPSRVMFLKYEDMKMDTVGNVKRIAEFLGQPFSMEEEAQGVVHQIVDLCSFEKMSNLEVNKNGILQGDVTNSVFFRKGEMGDYVNYLTAEMIERIDRIIEEKFAGFNLSI